MDRALQRVGGHNPGLKPRIALVGAGRTRQGLGPFVARFFKAAGAQVCGHVGRSAASRAATSEHLQGILGHPCPGYTDLASLHAAQEVHALAILCPPEFHLTYLQQAADLGLHTLCEKPLVLRWKRGEPDVEFGVREIVTTFSQRGLVLQENCQWPHVLPSFRRLCGETLAPVQRFAMGLSPSAHGVTMGVDSLSHPLSLLQALLPGPARVEAAKVVGTTTAGPRSLRFSYVAGSQTVAAEVHLEDSPERPRPAWLKINGQRADRLIRAEDYAIFLEAEGRRVAVPDPLETHLRGFVESIQHVRAGAAPPPTDALLDRATMLQALLRAFPASDHPPSSP